MIERRIITAPHLLGLISRTITIVRAGWHILDVGIDARLGWPTAQMARTPEETE